MSDNVQEEPPAAAAAPEKPTRRWAWKNLKGRFLIISILFHIILIGGATYLVVQTFAPRKQTFKPGPATARNKAVEHKINMVKKKNSMTAPATQKITTKGVSKVVLPDMPAVPTMSAVSSPTMGAGTGPFGAGGMANGTGAGGGGMPLFGLKAGGLGLEGTFYDLKQTRAGRPSELIGNPASGDAVDGAEMAVNDGYIAALQKFVKSGFGQALSRYFKGPDVLYSTQIFIPELPAGEAPKAFNLEGKVRGKRWAVAYSGKVIPPVSGQFRFIGIGDDVLLVRFNGRVVLDAGLVSLTGKRPKEFFNLEGMAEEAPPPKDVNHTFIRNFASGDVFTVRAGTPYEIEILIGETPGGFFKAMLLLDQIGAEYQKDNRGNPKFPIFKLAHSDTSGLTGEVPVYGNETPWSVWKSVPAAAPAGGGLLGPR